MARPSCLNCLSESLLAVSLSQRNALATSQSFFSTTARAAKNNAVLKAKNSKAPPPKKGGSLSLKLKKNVRVKTGKPPQIGERKAIRKRVVLSNVNAPEVKGLQSLDASNCKTTRLQSLEGHVLGFEDAGVDTLRALDAFKSSQGWGLFRRPATIIRGQTVELARRFDKIEESVEKRHQEAGDRIIITGERGSGKSVIQLQAMALAQQRGWILIHIPDAQEFTNGNTAYQPVRNANGEAYYLQPHLTADLLNRIRKANAAVLDKLQLSQEHKFPVPVQKNISLSRLLDLGADDPDLAFPVWQAFLSEVTTATQAQGQPNRPPVLLTVDGIGFTMRDSLYLDANVKPIHAHQFALVQSINSFLNGSRSMANGGMVLVSTSESNRVGTPDMDYLLAKTLSQSSGQAEPRWTSFKAVDERVIRALGDAQVWRVAGLTKEEAKSIMEYYALSGMMRTTITDTLVGEKWVTCGGGIIGEIEKSCVLRAY